MKAFVYYNEENDFNLYVRDNKRVNKFCFIIFVFCVLMFLFFSIASYCEAVSKDLSNNIFRLHVIANSDSADDQALKLKVRDAVIAYMNSICGEVSSKDEAIRITNEHLDDFKRVAENVVANNGYFYPIAVEIGNFDFPTKEYGDISLPAGFYDALRIKIGNSSGHNWWCVMFPPLGFVDVSSGVVPEDSKENLQENLSDEDYDLISQDDDVSDFKFKIVEMFNSWVVKVATN